MELSPDDFNTFLSQVGQTVQWRKSSLCPCRDEFSGAAKPGCPSCAGRGVIWADPVSSVCAPCGQRIQRQWQSFGQFESGDLVVSVGSDEPLYDCGEFDRILLTDSSEPFRSVMTRTGAENLTYAVQSIDEVFWLDPTTHLRVNGGLPAVTDAGVVDWAVTVGGAPPPVGMQYSISGRRIAEYFVFSELPGDRAHFHGAALPRRIAFRKLDLFGRK